MAYANGIGERNTGIGAGVDVTGSGLNNVTVIGYAALANASNKMRFGNGDITVIEGNVDWTVPSDARFKYNVSDTGIPGLSFINRLRPVTYQFDRRKFDQHLMQHMPDSIREQRLAELCTYRSDEAIQTGFLAQEVERICNDLGYTFSGLHVPESDVDNYGLAYGSFVPLLVKAIQEQQTEIEELRAINMDILTRLTALESNR